MKSKTSVKESKAAKGVLKALQRAGKKAVELARLTGTPALVIRNGQIVDAAKRKSIPAKKKRNTKARNKR
ncbi:MAG: hypothetical protein ACJ8FY_13310 [Gemmataceae bacterium]